jgi:hypothetical protein
VNQLKARSCLIDGEAVVCDDNGLAVFERLRYQRGGRTVFLFAFDLLELDGTDLRREPFIPAMSCSGTLARWGWRGSCRSGWARATARGGRRTG